MKKWIIGVGAIIVAAVGAFFMFFNKPTAQKQQTSNLTLDKVAPSEGKATTTKVATSTEDPDDREINKDTGITGGGRDVSAQVNGAAGSGNTDQIKTANPVTPDENYTPAIAAPVESGYVFDPSAPGKVLPGVPAPPQDELLERVRQMSLVKLSDKSADGSEALAVIQKGIDAMVANRVANTTGISAVNTKPQIDAMYNHFRGSESILSLMASLANNFNVALDANSLKASDLGGGVVAFEFVIVKDDGKQLGYVTGTYKTGNDKAHLQSGTLLYDAYVEFDKQLYR